MPHNDSQFQGETLLYEGGSALALLDASESRFLTHAVRDAVRAARDRGQYEAKFLHYSVHAWRDSLGSRLITVTWRVNRDGERVAGDTHVLVA